MREINQDIVKQIPGEPRRRWFVNDYFDLLIWENEDKKIVGFQLCYDKSPNQRAITWYENKAIRHDKVDDGENKPGKYKSAPILFHDGMFDCLEISKKFKSESIDIDPKVANFVYEKILKNS